MVSMERVTTNPLVPASLRCRIPAKLADISIHFKPRKIEEKFSPDLWEEFLRESKGVTRTGMDPAATRTQCLKFVFPEHLNPGGYTFGGNILSWMHDSAYLCGSKFAKQRLLLSASINKVSFLVPSTNTDVLVFSCQVNRVFNSSFVVGCRVEKVDQADPENLIHICSGQFTMVASDPSKLQQIFPRTEEDQRRFYRASVRRADRIKELASEEFNLTEE
jgi:acyl-CoA hydrolase